MRSIFSYWHFDIIITGFIILLITGYLYTTKFDLPKKSFYFFAGIILIVVSLASPLHFIGENYLFSAHMTSHVLILLIGAPLIVAGIPSKNRFKKTLLLISKGLMRFPLLSWGVGVSIMWFWHIPYIFNKLFTMDGMGNGSMYSMGGLMNIHLLSLLIAGIIFSWPLLNPYQQHRIAPLSGVIYLSTACIFCSLLGLLITFSPVGIYSHYINIIDHYGYLPMVRNEWKISAEADKQIAGLIMWVPCCLIYLSASMYLLIKWFEAKEVSEPANSILTSIK